MKQLIAILAAVLVGFTAQAVDRITATITVTNPPVTGNSITINSGVRYWTNASAASTIQTNLVGKNHSATNLYDQIANNPYSGGVIVRWSTTNEIKLIGPLGGALAGSLSGNWGTLTLSTQSGPGTYTAIYPFENITGETNRTNQASAFTAGISAYSTNAFPTNAAAMSNFLTKGASPPQTVTSELRISGNINNGTSSLSVSNLANYGNAIRSFGSGGNSFQAGSNATSSAARSVAIGNSATASGTDSLAAGTSAQATNSNATAVGVSTTANQLAAAFGTTAAASGNASTAIGSGSQATGAGSTAIGQNVQATAAGAFAGGQDATATADYAIAIGNEDTSATGTNAIAIGYTSTATGYRSTSIGAGAAASHDHSTAIGGFDHTGTAPGTTTTNQLRLGTSSQTISIPGIVDGPTTTNATLRGTNIINGRVDYTSRANAGLANGNNAGVVLGTNVFVRLSGPTGNYTLNGFAAEQDGSFHILELDNPTSSITVANNSGTDPTAANRITTGTGADVTITNNPAFLQVIYNTTASRWRVISYSR